jgi:opacity protein-like surface antigen
MKKIILTAIAICAFGFAQAQDMKYGVRGGIDMVSASASGYSESTTGFYVGGFTEFEMSDKITLQPGLGYHTASKDGAKFDYLSIPVMAKYGLSDNIHLVAGPGLYYSMDSEDKDKTRFNLGVGGVYDISENLFVEPRYDMGLTGDVKVNHFLISVGYKF